MLRSTKMTLALLFLLLTSLLTVNLIRVNAQSATGQYSMINGVLAHEMTSQEARTLAKSFFSEKTLYFRTKLNIFIT